MNVQEMPHELLRLIGSFLDLDSRIAWNRCLTHIDDKYSSKLKISPLTTHFYMEYDYLKHMLDLCENRSKSHVYVPRVLSHLAQTRSTMVEIHFKAKFIHTVIDKAHELLENMPHYRRLYSKKQLRNLTQICKDVIKRQSSRLSNVGLAVPPRPREPWFAGN